MHIRKFYGNGMKTVLQQAKQELGDDVVILSQKTLPGGRVELVAATEPRKEAPAVEFNSLESEIAEIKQMLLSLVEEREMMRLGKAALLLYRELKQKGMSEACAYQTVQELARGASLEDLLEVEALRRELRKLLLNRIGVTQPLTDGKLCIGLLGRTGVGKTTTLAKLASMERYVRKRKVSILSLDVCRVGAREELNRIGKLLGVPTALVFTREELAEKIREFGAADTLFLDTPGRALKEKELREMIAEVADLCPHAHFHLLLSPNYTREVLLDDLAEYGRFGPKSLILTKLDEARSLGGLMDAVLNSSMPLSWITNGQDIPHDIQPADKGWLVDRLMEAP